jgi:hypothetical protein
MARRRDRPEVESVLIPREVLEGMKDMEEAPLRAVLFMCYHERLSFDWPVLVTPSQVARGAGVSVERVRRALTHLLAEGLVQQGPDGRYCLAGPVPAERPEEQGRRGGGCRPGKGTARVEAPSC